MNRRRKKYAMECTENLERFGRLCGLIGSALEDRSLPPEFESRRVHN